MAEHPTFGKGKVSFHDGYKSSQVTIKQEVKIGGGNFGDTYVADVEIGDRTRKFVIKRILVAKGFF